MDSYTLLKTGNGIRTLLRPKIQVAVAKLRNPRHCSDCPYDLKSSQSRVRTDVWLFQNRKSCEEDVVVQPRIDSSRASVGNVNLFVPDADRVPLTCFDTDTTADVN